MGDEPREPGAEGREERDETQAGEARENKPGGVISIIQQNAVVIDGRFVTRRDQKRDWI